MNKTMNNNLEYYDQYYIEYDYIPIQLYKQDNIYINILKFIIVFQLELFIFYTLYYTTISLIKLIKNSKKKLYIIKGVPGSGKHSFVYFNEKKYNSKNFGICSSKKYFNTFDPKNISKSEKYSNIIFNLMIEDNVNRIYVVGLFPQMWMYSDYMLIAENNNYDVEVINITCPDKEHLRFFNSRSDIPMKKSIECAQIWQTDFFEEITYNAYIPYHEGDSLPDKLDKNQLKNKLDIELDEISNDIKKKNTYFKQSTDSSIDRSELYNYKCANKNIDFIDEYDKQKNNEKTKHFHSIAIDLMSS